MTGKSNTPSRSKSHSHEHLITIRDCLRQIVSDFNHADICFGHGYPDALSEAWAAVGFVLQLPMSEEAHQLFLDARLSPEEIKNIFALTDARIREKKPLAYLTGEAWLSGYRFLVTPGTIVPRSLVAEPILQRLSPWLPDDFYCDRALELCCGGGSILVMTAEAFSEAVVDGVDINTEAIELAQKNIAEYGLQSRINLFQGDLFKALPKKHPKYDLIISNPPYVKTADLKHIPAEYRHEPKLALDGGKDGLALVDTIITDAKKWLNPSGVLLLEIGGNAEAFFQKYAELNPVFINNDANEDCVLLIEAENLQ